MMTKASVAKRVQDLALANGGRVSFDQFVCETGIPAQRLRQQPWFPGWNALLLELGIETAVFSKPRTPEGTVVAAIARLIKRIGRWPTNDDFARARKSDDSFPSLKVISRIKNTGRLPALLKDYCSADASLSLVAGIAEAQPQADVSIDHDIEGSDRVKGYVYMLRGSGRKYKIGHTNSPNRRFRQVQLEVPDPLVQVHSIPTDDPEGIEKYWHNRFVEKRIRNIEFFELDADDVRAFKRRKYQ